MLYKEFKKQGDFLFRYRGSLPIIILFLGFGILIATSLNSIGEENFLQSNIYFLICFAVSWLGQIIRILTVGYTPANTSGRNKLRQVADEINTTGIYSTVRHPLYLGNFFMWLGLAMLTENLWFVLVFVLFYWIYYERIMYAEETFLVGKFGSKYENWAIKTPAFIPGFKEFKKPSIPFSWKKILKKEKNGISALFLIFFLFNFTANIIDAGKFVIVKNFWFYAMIVSLVLYLILKFLKRKTTVLDEEGR
jgi:protein-S-isoprenylcysteine O-methyltransferase Ste14